ncbi:hypothetical protein DFH09DRAFT_1128149, partial [Mycena vulgaris]
ADSVPEVARRGPDETLPPCRSQSVLKPTSTARPCHPRTPQLDPHRRDPHEPYCTLAVDAPDGALVHCPPAPVLPSASCGPAGFAILPTCRIRSHPLLSSWPLGCEIRTQSLVCGPVQTWGGVVLDREVVLDAAAGFAGLGYGTEGHFWRCVWLGRQYERSWSGSGRGICIVRVGVKIRTYHTHPTTPPPRSLPRGQTKRSGGLWRHERLDERRGMGMYAPL